MSAIQKFDLTTLRLIIFPSGLLDQAVAWVIAVLVMVINGYLLLDFFTGKVTGLIVGSLVCIVTAAYLAFIVYLILRDIGISSMRNIFRSRRVVDAES